MARKNAEVERLERENAFLRDALARLRADPGDIPFAACDNSCVVAAPKGGMMTNGGCRCDETKLRRGVMWWRRRAQFLQATVMEMRDGKPEDNLAQNEALRAAIEARRG